MLFFQKRLSQSAPAACIVSAGEKTGGKEAVATESTPQRTGGSLQRIYAEQADRVYRVAYLYMKNHHDSEDVVQDVFVKLIRTVRSGKTFDSREHEKAWLIITTANTCKNKLRSKSRSELDLDELYDLPAPERDPERSEVLEAVLALPELYRSVVYLFYYEGYRTDEIARMLGERPAAIRARLSRARKRLKQELGGDFFDQ